MNHRAAILLSIAPIVVFASAGLGICPCAADAGPTKGLKVSSGGPGGVLLTHRWQAPEYCDIKPGIVNAPCEIECSGLDEGWFACRFGWEHWPLVTCEASRHCINVCCNESPEITHLFQAGCGFSAYFLKCPTD